MRVGVIGVGTISAQYFAQFPRLAQLELVAVADLDTARAEQVARDQGIRALTVDELLADSAVDLALNLTIPAAHADIARRALAAGKHVYGEKPLALTTAEATPVIDAARSSGRRIGSAPDTVLGTGIQTARNALDAGEIGEPVAAMCQWASAGHELWHPAPAFYYQPGGGPLYDMGPYYLTALVTLLGPIRRVSGVARSSARKRSIATGVQAETAIPVDVDTHVSAVLEHVSGVTSTVTVSFEVWASRVPLFEVYGTAGTLAVPDPNTFGGVVEVATVANREFIALPDAAGFVDSGRGIGLADLADAVAAGRPERASGDLAFHVLEVMEGVIASSIAHEVIEIGSRPERPAAVPLTRLD